MRVMRMRGPQLWGSLMLAAVSTLLALVGAEVGLRAWDGYALVSIRLRDRESVGSAAPAPAGRPATRGYVARLRVPADVRRDWFDIDPPVPPRSPVEPELTRRFWSHPGHELPSVQEWNRLFLLGQVCSPATYASSVFFTLDSLFVFDPLGKTEHPTYRFLRRVTDPSGLVANSFGWRGLELSLDKPPRTVRIAFLGASTTVASHGFPFSYPEHVGAFLNQWARSTGRDVAFEIINAGRSGIGSTSIAAIARQEVAPVEPDLLVYYEGSNQFWPAQFVQWSGGAPPPRPKLTFAQRTRWEDYSAVARRVVRLLYRTHYRDGREPWKPPQRVAWPADLNELDPPLGSPQLPLNLPVILRDLDDIRLAASAGGAELVVSSFVWLVHEGLRLDPQRHASIARYLNETFHPFTYGHMRRMADFQNRVLAKYARRRRLPFLDVAALYPQDPDLFWDAIHMTEEGTRLHGWVVFLGLLPIIEAKLADGTLPRADAVRQERHPAFPDGIGRRLETLEEIRTRCPK